MLSNVINIYCAYKSVLAQQDRACVGAECCHSLNAVSVTAGLDSGNSNSGKTISIVNISLMFVCFGMNGPPSLHIDVFHE